MRILLGISGGIAAYKSVELIRQFIARGCSVRVVMTEAATAFITPLTLQVISGHPVQIKLFNPASENGLDHLELARWAEILLIAPATADLLARLALGLADDLLTTIALASTAPLYLAPAMNQIMWQHPATQNNLNILKQRGAYILGPASGIQACGENGPGRMLEPLEIADLITSQLKLLQDIQVLITAGPTREPFDPVRYVSNRSSGQMGYALAAALSQLGARVVLISGPTALPIPQVAEFIKIETALEMQAAVQVQVAACQIFIGAAAVADYRPINSSNEKIKKDAPELTMKLIRNPDLLAEVANRSTPPFTVGFAAETHELEHYAREKLIAKRVDLIAANLVGGEHGGFECTENALLILWHGGQCALPKMEKTLLARKLAVIIAERYKIKFQLNQ